MKQLLTAVFILSCSMAIAQGNVGIGVANPQFRLHVEDSSTAIYGNSTHTGYGVMGNSEYAGVFGTGKEFGVRGEGGFFGCYGSGGSTGVLGVSDQYGVFAQGGVFAIYANSTNTAIFANGTRYGISGMGTDVGSLGVEGSGLGIGVSGSSESGTGVAGTSTNGPGAMLYSTNGNGLVVGTGRTDKNWAAVFNGSVISYGTYQLSDLLLKKNIQQLDNAIGIIGQLKPRAFEFSEDSKLDKLHLPLGMHYGLIAQDVAEVLPYLVKDVQYTGPLDAAIPDTLFLKNRAAGNPVKPFAEGILSRGVNYIELIPIIIKALQEQQAIIEKQNEKIAALNEKISQLTLGTPNLSPL